MVPINEHGRFSIILSLRHMSLVARDSCNLDGKGD